MSALKDAVEVLGKAKDRAKLIFALAGSGGVAGALVEAYFDVIPELDPGDVGGGSAFGVLLGYAYYGLATDRRRVGAALARFGHECRSVGYLTIAVEAEELSDLVLSKAIDIELGEQMLADLKIRLVQAVGANARGIESSLATETDLDSGVRTGEEDGPSPEIEGEVA